jgi:N-acetylneuraminic acid mutarotase
MAAQHRWTLLENYGDVYTARTGHTVVNESGAFYLFGGTDGAARQSDAHAYNVETQLWQEIRASGRPPPARSGAQAVVWNGHVWFFGGYTKKDGDYFNDVFTFDIATSQWDSVATPGECPGKRTDHSVVLFREYMIVFGGSDGRNRFNDMWELNLRERRWMQTTSPTPAPRGRFAHTAVMYDSGMFVFGGWDGQDTLRELHEYNVSSNMWIALPPRGTAPSARYRHTAVLCGDAMFTFGGVDKAQNRFPDLYEYRFQPKMWNKVNTTGNAPTARTFHKAVVHNGCMYILGGFDGRRLNDMHCVQLRTVQELARLQAQDRTAGMGAQSSSGQWGRGQAPGAGANSAVGDAQDAAAGLTPEDMWAWHQVRDQQGHIYTPRTGHAVIVWNHCFYLMGGTDENARQNDIYRYDVRKRIWALVGPASGHAPSARSGSKAVICRDSIFFFGGYTKKDGDYFNDLFEFNIPRAHWSRIDAMDRPSVRTDHSCIMYEASMYIFGGFDASSRFSDLHQYSIDDRKWLEIPATGSTPMGRFGHSAVVHMSGMFVFGGWNGHDTLDDLYEFSLTTKHWYSIPGRGDMPPSRYRHSAAVYGCCMFIFGGVDKRQERFSDLFEFNFDTRSWARLKTFGDPPTARTFHCAVMYGGEMYILGGFDGQRRNDMYRIAMPEQLPREEKRRRRLITLPGESESAIEPESAADSAADQKTSNSQEDQLRLQVQELQKRLEVELERHLCKICYEREIDTVLLDCNHRTVCQRCLEQVQLCPLCRVPISNVVQTFNA